MYKKFTVLTIIFLLLTITVSFAWIMEINGPSGDLVSFDYEESIFIDSNNLDITISVEKNGTYVPLYSSSSETNVITKFENSAPGDVYKYSLKIRNLTTNPITTSIILSDISSSIDDFYNYISIGIFSTKGFDSKYKAPALTEFSILSKLPKDSDENVIIKEQNTITFLDNLKVPPMEDENDSIEIKFYVRFNSIRDSQNYLQNQTFVIGKINFMCI